MKSTFLSLIFLSAATGLVQSATYATNFDSASYIFGADIHGVDGWSLTGGPADTEVAAILSSPFPLPSSSGQALHLGYGSLSGSSAYLSRNSGQGLVANGDGYSQFKATYTVQDSLPGYPGSVNRDSFAFTLRGVANENLITINLSPTAQTLTPQFTPPRTDQYSWTSDFASGSLNIGTLNENQSSVLDVYFTPSGLNDVRVVVKFAGVTSVDTILVGAATQSVGDYGMIWTPLNAALPGSNVLIVDDLSGPGVVPEPSASLLLGLAGLGLLSRRRRN